MGMKVLMALLMFLIVLVPLMWLLTCVSTGIGHVVRSMFKGGESKKTGKKVGAKKPVSLLVKISLGIFVAFGVLIAIAMCATGDADVKGVTVLLGAFVGIPAIGWLLVSRCRLAEEGEGVPGGEGAKGSLVACPGCQKDVSPTADACPHCGFSFVKVRQELRQEERRKDTRCGCLIVLAAGLVAWILLWPSSFGPVLDWILGHVG